MLSRRVCYYIFVQGTSPDFYVNDLNEQIVALIHSWLVRFQPDLEILMPL